MNLFINAYIKNKLSSDRILNLNSTYYMLTKLMPTESTVFNRLQNELSACQHMSAYHTWLMLGNALIYFHMSSGL